MVYGWMGRMHALVLGLRDERGQGTVEYVGLILLVAGILTAVVIAGAPHGKEIGESVVDKLTDAIDGVGKK
jgi:Flp pilus assembly pilin Flp